MDNLNEIKEGSILEFFDAPNGVVEEIWTQVMKGDDIVESRLNVKHKGYSSYYTYRRDGRCHYYPKHDITGVVN